MDVSDIERLLQELEEKTGSNPRYGNLKLISELIGGTITAEYLYQHVIRKRRAALSTRSNQIGINPTKLHELIRFLGYRDFKAFQTKSPVY